jgi:hypothetical protein
MKLTGENRSTRGKTRPSATLSKTNPTLDRTRDSALRDRRLTAWAMARPAFVFTQWLKYRLKVVVSVNCATCDKSDISATLLLKILHFLSILFATTCFGLSSGHHLVVNLQLYKRNCKVEWVRYMMCYNWHNIHQQLLVSYTVIIIKYESRLLTCSYKINKLISIHIADLEIKLKYTY